MGIVYVARSAGTSKWASDVGLGKSVFKLGVVEGEAELKAALDAGWAGETDWKLVAKQDAEGLAEDDAIDRLARKEKMVEPNLYPRLRGARGLFKVSPTNVENHLLVARAMANQQTVAVKTKPADFAAYMIHNVFK
ncbi:MAG: hypothetical protein HQL41_08535 [Alphaproteobacteria bacterium]|nr:hypothetical protein [Alphaproteobacteria bacterium]